MSAGKRSNRKSRTIQGSRSEQIEDLRRALAATFLAAQVRIGAVVVLPDQLHAMWTLPNGDSDFPSRWRKIKARFSRSVGLEFLRRQSMIAKRERGLWQRRYWEHMIREAADFDLDVRFFWGNPVKHGLVARPVDWPYSSIHLKIRQGLVEATWSGAAADGGFGERPDIA